MYASHFQPNNQTTYKSSQLSCQGLLWSKLLLVGSTTAPAVVARVPYCHSQAMPLTLLVCLLPSLGSIKKKRYS